MTDNEVLTHLDFSNNYCFKFNEELQAIHYGEARQQVEDKKDVSIPYVRGASKNIQSFIEIANNCCPQTKQ